MPYIDFPRQQPYPEGQRARFLVKRPNLDQTVQISFRTATIIFLVRSKQLSTVKPTGSNNSNAPGICRWPSVITCIHYRMKDRLSTMLAQLSVATGSASQMCTFLECSVHCVVLTANGQFPFSSFFLSATQESRNNNYSAQSRFDIGKWIGACACIVLTVHQVVIVSTIRGTGIQDLV